MESNVKIHPSWDALLSEVNDTIENIGQKIVDGLREDPQKNAICPQPKNVFRAFEDPMDDVKVVIVGQDPYPTPGHAMGLSFSVSPDVKPVPKSLNNIFKELNSDIGCPQPTSGDLSPWSKQGVLLLNRVLTTFEKQTAAHVDWGWDIVTNHVIKHLAQRDKPLVGVLWGKKAQELKPFFGSKPVITSSHPSPLSASRGFFGSKPFSKINELLIQQGAKPIIWDLP